MFMASRPVYILNLNFKLPTLDVCTKTKTAVIIEDLACQENQSVETA